MDPCCVGGTSSDERDPDVARAQELGVVAVFRGRFGLGLQHPVLGQPLPAWVRAARLDHRLHLLVESGIRRIGDLQARGEERGLLAVEVVVVDEQHVLGAELGSLDEVADLGALRFPVDPGEDHQLPQAVTLQLLTRHGGVVLRADRDHHTPVDETPKEVRAPFRQLDRSLAKGASPEGLIEIPDHQLHLRGSRAARARIDHLDSPYHDAGSAPGRRRLLRLATLARVTRTVAIVQARTGSTRLPGKVMLDLAGEPLLARVVERTQRATTVDDVVVATTSLPEDDVLERLAGSRGWRVVRGHPLDLTDRYHSAALQHRADVVVRITADCPLIDPALIDETVQTFRGAGWDYASNTLEPRTYPRGLDVEVLTMAALERAWREDDNMAWREHATPYLYRHPELFRLLRIAGAHDHSAHRWTVDTLEDLNLVRRIYAAIGHDRFGWQEALAVVLANPTWAELNRAVRQKSVQG